MIHGTCERRRSSSRRADYILTYDASTRSATPSRLRVHATAGPRAIQGGCGSRRRPDIRRHTGARFSLRTCTRCRVLPSLSAPLYLPFNLRLPTALNQERSDRRLTREQSTREGAPGMPEILSVARSGVQVRRGCSPVVTRIDADVQPAIWIISPIFQELGITYLLITLLKFLM